jgi:hypothetical protein
MRDPKSAAQVRESIARDAEVFRGRLLDTELALWNSLLAVNGLSIAAATAFATTVDTGPKRLALLIAVLISFISAGLVFGNFRRRRRTYRSLSFIPSLEVCADDVKFAACLRHLEERRSGHDVDENTNRGHEKVAVILLAAALVVIVATVYAKVCGF